MNGMMRDIHVVVSGCSFTISDGNPHPVTKRGGKNRSWAWHLADQFEEDQSFTFHNVGLSGAGNHLISMNCIDTVEHLLKRGIDPKDIYVMIQWSGLFRPTIYSELTSKTATDAYAVSWDEIRTDDSNLKKISHIEHKRRANNYPSSGHWMCSFGHPVKKDKFWGTYFEEYFSLGPAFMHTIDAILKTQWYLKSKGIQYRMFNAWDIFTVKNDWPSDSFAGKKGGMWFGSFHPFSFFKEEHYWGCLSVLDQFSETRYTNREHLLLKDVYVWAQPLWKMIDWDNFWIFENEIVQFGGMIQWVQDPDNIPPVQPPGNPGYPNPPWVESGDWYVGSGEDKNSIWHGDFHIPTRTSKIFTDRVISPMFSEMVTENGT